jgi:hypothetical protein
MTEHKNYPKKYWWLAVLVVPVLLASISILPSLLRASGDGDDGGGGGGGNENRSSIVGDHNTVTNIVDNSSKMTVINNVSMIAKEYEKYTGQPLSDDLKQQIDRAVAAAVKNDHAESVRLFEQIANQVPVPAVFNNLGVEYAKTQNADASQRAFGQAIAKDPQNEQAKKNLDRIASAGGRGGNAPAATGPGVRFDGSSAAAMVVEELQAKFAPAGDIHIVETGTAGEKGGSYAIKYQPKPGATVLVEPNTYDVLMKTGGGGVFVLAKNVQVKDRTIARINPNALVGGVAIATLTRKGFPEIKEVYLLDRASGDNRLIRQWTDKLGVTMPIVPGNYDVLGKTADDVQFDLVKNVEVKAREITRIETDNEVAAIVVQKPDLSGLDVKAIYALRTGTNQIAGKSDAFGKPMMVFAGEQYDVALEQPAGLTRIRSKLTPTRGTLTEVR